MKDISNVLEVGGGMGSLMHDFLSLHSHSKATMVDISPFLLAKQKTSLQNFNVRFWEKDILQLAAKDLSGFDLVIMNENLGDLPTLVFDPEQSDSTDDFLNRAHYFISQYHLQLQPNENINIGAMEALEKFCLAGVKYIYFSEHSCEAVVPKHLQAYLHFESLNAPEMISLKGHNEYTIKFSYLQRIAEKFKYKIIRGPFADFFEIDFNDRIRTALQMLTPYNDEQEIIRQFVYDLYKYEYLIMIKGE
jgi:hypothetical protein